jgi:hypothetical protein
MRGPRQLASRTEDLKLAIHHVGGRGGTRRFPTIERFESGIVNVLYEADASAIDAIRAATSQQSSEQRALAVCVTGQAGPVRLRKLYNSAASSTLGIDPELVRLLPWLGEGVIDYDTGAWSSLGSSELQGQTLDDILLSRDPQAPLPDFLSINTQGTEADIIAGGRTVLAESCLALLCEVSFSPIYQGQATFNDLCSEAGRLGYYFTQFAHHGLRGHGFTIGSEVLRTPIGLKGGGVQLQSDALYFKKPEAILARHRQPMIDLLKGIFVGFVYEYFDYSFACAATFARCASWRDREALETARSRFAYLDFAGRYLDELARYPRIYPVTWTQVFAADADRPRDKAVVREKYFAQIDKAKFQADLQGLLEPDFIGLENCAIEFGLQHQAEQLRYHRLAVVWEALRYLGLAIDEEEHRTRLDLSPLEEKPRPGGPIAGE